jgi:predicted TIM-barrel fold metal-dependent hydrolase
MSKFDTHAHVFIQGLALAEKCRYVPEYDATVQDYLAHLDQNGFDVGILIQPSFLGTDNHFLLDALRSHPHRLRGVVVVNPNISRHELQKMDAAGVIGIRLNLIGEALPDLSSSEWQRLLTDIKQLGWHVELHRPAADLAPLIETLMTCGVKIVIDHFGLPDVTLLGNDPGFLSLLEKAHSGRIWLKLSGGYRNGGAGVGEKNVATLMPALLAHFGAERLLWGSDWPHTRFENTINYRQTVNTFEQWVPDADTRRQILSAAPDALIHLK